jgi:hypothetical protein
MGIGFPFVLDMEVGPAFRAYSARKVPGSVTTLNVRN